MQGALSDTDIDTLLARCVIGHLGCCENGKPHVFPMAFAYRDNVLYGQTTEGAKVAIMRENPVVCFQVEEMTDMGWESAALWGTFEELDFEQLSPGSATVAAELLSVRIGKKQAAFGMHIPYVLGEKMEPVSVNGKRATLFRIVVREKSGRFLRHE